MVVAPSALRPFSLYAQLEIGDISAETNGQLRSPALLSILCPCMILPWR